MRVLCEIKDIPEDNQERLAPGRYLVIYKFVNNKDLKFILSFSEFQGYYEESKRDSSTVMTEPGISMEEAPLPLAQKQSTPDFKKIMGYLTESIAITESDFEDDEFIVESSFGDFLELPWEQVTKKGVYVLRRVIGDKKDATAEDINNFLFVVSNSHITPEGEAFDLKEKLKQEILEIIDHAIEAIPKDFKIDSLHISKHTTKDSFKLLPWDQSKYAHILMHGDKNGGLCLEKADPDYYKYQDVMDTTEVITTLTDKNLFLLFLSICNSGGGWYSINNNLAFQAANKGIAKYTIGYRFGVGEDSALRFSGIFYKTLLNGSVRNEAGWIEEVYKKSLAEYYKEPISDNGYIPLLYVNSYL